jgi:glycosyltransferase involved in cell wall biosynthesis
MAPSLVAISVVIPARNEARFVLAAVDSALAQAYEGPVECIVADNGSTDGSADLVRRRAATGGGRLKLIEEPRTGVSRAKNAGARAASGDVLIFLDADSRMAPGLARAVAVAYAAGSPVGSIRVLADGGSWVDRAFFRMMEFGKVRLGIRAQMLYCVAKLFHELNGFDEELLLGEDVDFLSRAAAHLRSERLPPVTHVTTGEILTSTRRLAKNHHLGMVLMFARWTLAFLSIGRRRAY